MAASHFMMTFEPLFYPALVTIALGNGLFLPSLPIQIDHLYASGDPRRSWVYSLCYLGVNACPAAAISFLAGFHRTGRDELGKYLQLFIDVSTTRAT